MLYSHNMRAAISYDAKILESDQMFVKFMSGDQEILILEDAENLLISRNQSENPLISRFLNVSDGLIKVNKKIVFTTNYSHFANLDEALVRPGRCFAFKEFRALTWVEALAVCRDANLPVPMERGEYTISELFNQKSVGFTSMKIGFTAS